MECGSDSDESLLAPVPHGSWGWKRVVGAAASATLLLAGAATMASGSFTGSAASATAVASNTVDLYGMVDVTPPRDKCSKNKDNCMGSGCCKTAGLNCYKTQQPGVAKCMKKCDGCEMLKYHMVAAQSFPGLSFYCFAVYMQDNGSPKKSYDLELLKGQKERGVGLFRCAEHNVYSDVEVALAPGVSTIKVADVKGDFHLFKRKETKTWVNTGLFFQVWKKIASENQWSRHNYVIKVDADAVFFPNKLFELLRNKGVPAEGLYYENCKWVDYGYFGNLEVMSRQAFATLLANQDSCYDDQTINWKVGVKNGKYGPMGEDLFAQQCMDLHGVAKVENFELTLDGTCPADRPASEKKNKKFVPSCQGAKTATIHPLKKPEEHFKCMQEADQSYPNH